MLCAVIIAVAGVSYIRQYSGKLFPPTAPAVRKSDADKWIESVGSGDLKKAVAYAANLCGGCELKRIPDIDYLKLAAEMKFSTLVFDAPFGRNDFLRWTDALAVRKFIPGRKIGADAGEIEGIAKAVLDKLECRPTPQGVCQTRTMSEILQRGYGNTHEITRILAEALFQAGYEVMIVSIFDDSRNLIHVVCEVRGKNQSAVIDTRFKKVWTGKVFADLAQDPSLSSGTWPGDIAKSAKSHVYGLPAEYQDYKVYNQNLQKALASSGIGGIPRFGDDPRRRIEEYLKHFGPNEKVPVTYWRYPFTVLMSQPDFPGSWRLEYEKELEVQ
ncbi:MAG TPA: hypothetical protein DET40_24925 [Lentisphaeria bacterium]|nr:hypothetical protein [Lentisphaeria bacterium]